MIQYALKCSHGHCFDSWFQSAAAYDKLRAAGMVSCAICGDVQVEKAIMTPRVRPARNAAETPKPTPETQDAVPLSVPRNAAEQALAELRKRVEDTSDYVGREFVSEARKMHLGDAPARAIYGEAKLDEARALVEDGVPVAPLPFMPNRKSN
ncbi:DUF1178 family protein [Ruegeria sp. 2205SS24-7]|uniref:DUF1178 family protein n=1 Tax=Ruegeria discodermiae TaxID=3064389 RepID=UPI002740AB18|nr:DUF1178 family protein [Ruegeria sp. 2205SS24-7]MDP5220500.1 DUF1178 family protein [Ruegeria sp. 2205SS24-7]